MPRNPASYEEEHPSSHTISSKYDPGMGHLQELWCAGQGVSVWDCVSLGLLPPIHPAPPAVFSSVSRVYAGVQDVFSKLYLGIPSKKMPYNCCDALEVPSQTFNL